MPKKILFVDDEKEILSAIRRSFHKTEYELYFAEGALTASAILKNHPIDLVVSDVMLTDGNGLELLKDIKKQYPGVLRVVFTGYLSEDKMMQILEKGLAKAVVQKPWDTDVLLETIEQVFRASDELKDPALLQLVNSIDHLPTLPIFYRKLNQLIEEDADIERIANEVSKDQSIAAKILRMANFAFYHRKTGSIKEAIMVLGLTNVKNIIVSNTVFNPSSFGLYHQTLWQHSILVNNLCQEIYKKFLGKSIPSMYATAGLMHDIGKVIMMSELKKDYNKLLFQVSAEQNKHLLQLEQEHFGISHQEIGAVLLQWWDLPYPIVEATLYHHVPFHENIINKEIVQVVHLANHYAWIMLKKTLFIEELDKRIFETLNIPKIAYEYFVTQFETEILPNLRA